MSTPTYKIIQTLHMIEGEGQSAVGVAERETVEPGLSWAEAKKRIRADKTLKAEREIEAAPVTVEL